MEHVKKYVKRGFVVVNFGGLKPLIEGIPEIS